MIYRGPALTIPTLDSPDPRVFARLKGALEDAFPPYASERFKYRILTEHLKLREASLLAECHANSGRPYTAAMTALTKRYGQPRRVVMQRISELIQNHHIRSGDDAAFRTFALEVRAAVVLLEQSGDAGRWDLENESSVTQLLSRLPQDLRVIFRKLVYTREIENPSLLDLAEWLDHEAEMRTMDSLECTRERSPNQRSDRARHQHHRDRSPRRHGPQHRRPTTLLMTTTDGNPEPTKGHGVGGDK